MAKNKATKKVASFSELNDALSVFSPDGDILDDCAYAKIDHFIPTGNYILNAAMSGSLFGGMPNRRSLTFAGEEGSGKTYLAMSICRNAIAMGYYIIYYDSEGSIDIEFAKRLGIDTSKIRIENISTIEEFAHLTAKLNETLEGMRDKGVEAPKVMVVLDSLGNLSSTKEKEDTTEGVNKRDMTKQQAIRRTFRVVGTDFAKNAVPFIICNHVYESIGSFFGGKTISGGGGLKYNSSMIFMLTKSKLNDKNSEKDNEKRNIDKHSKIGIVITVTPTKQRFARPIKVQFHLPFYKAPNPYVGLEKFVSWESCGIVRGKALLQKDFDKLTEKEQATCFKFAGEVETKLTQTAFRKLNIEEANTVIDRDGEKFIKKHTVKYAWPKDTARTLVCMHEFGEVPLAELYTNRVFTDEVLKELDENVIKPTFMLPSIESLEDLADVTDDLSSDLAGMQMDEIEDES